MLKKEKSNNKANVKTCIPLDKDKKVLNKYMFKKMIINNKKNNKKSKIK